MEQRRLCRALPNKKSLQSICVSYRRLFGGEVEDEPLPYRMTTKFVLRIVLIDLVTCHPIHKWLTRLVRCTTVGGTKYEVSLEIVFLRLARIISSRSVVAGVVGSGESPCRLDPLYRGESVEFLSEIPPWIHHSRRSIASFSLHLFGLREAGFVGLY